MTQSAVAWCRSNCTGLQPDSISRLAARDATDAERSEAFRVVSDSLAARTGGARLELSLAPVATISVSKSKQEVFDVELQVGSAPWFPSTLVDPPRSMHFLLVRAATGALSPLEIDTDESYYKFGERGELLAAVDLDADGTDELLLERTYNESNEIQLVRREKGRLIILGRFGIGT